MKVSELKKRLINGSREIRNHEQELTDIDSHFGDADHGLTMHKVADAIEKAATEAEDDVKGLFEKVAEEVGVLNGGSAIPLWSSWLEGMADVAQNGEETDLAGLKEMFANGFEEFDFMSGAKVGQKTIMDALAPASEAIEEAEDEDALFEKAASAAWEGAQKTKDYIAKFGRAKSYGDKTIGTCDAGALSMAYFFCGLANKE